jgi:hypothetical protein
MIGEVRDLETAEIAVQSALTGHLVLSTIHTNDAASTVNRLLDMGVEDYLLTSTVIGILAQRLVRTLCESCKEPYIALPEVVEEFGLTRFTKTSDITLYHPKGCPQCAQTGYTGRISIMEMLPMTDPLRSLVMKHATATELRSEAMREGMLSMYEDGLRKAVRGITTFEECSASRVRLSTMPVFRQGRQPGRRRRYRRDRSRERERDRRSPARPGHAADAGGARRGRSDDNYRKWRGAGGERPRYPVALVCGEDRHRRSALSDHARARHLDARGIAARSGAGSFDQPVRIAAHCFAAACATMSAAANRCRRLDARREVFSRFYVNIVRAGEAGGALGLVLQRLAETMERNKELRESVRSALIYPTILIGVAVLSVMVLLVWVVPQF